MNHHNVNSNVYRFFTVMLFSFAVLLSGCFWGGQKDLILYDNLYAQYQSAYASKLTLDNFEQADIKPSSVFVGLGLLQKNLDLLQNLEVYPKEQPSGFNDAHVVVNNLVLNGTEGALPLTLELTAVSEEKDLSISVHADATLVFDRYAPIEIGGPKHAIFKVKIGRINPSINWSFFSWKNSKLLSDWALVKASEALKSEANTLRISVPIDLPININTKIDEKKELPLNDDLKSKPKALVSVKSKGGQISRDLTLDLPLFVGEGVYLVAGNLPKPGKPPLSKSADKRELKKALSNLKDAIRNTKSILPAPDSDIVISLDMAILEDLLAQYSEIPTGDRAVAIRTLKYDKRIKDENGHYVDLRKKSPINVDVQPGNPTLQWKGDRVHFSISATAKATIHAHVHLHTGIGGGFGHDLTIKGAGSPMIIGSIGFDRFKSGGREALVLNPELQCNQFKIKAAETGELKLGVNMWQYVGDSPITPIIVMSDIPMVTKVKDKDLKKKDYEIRTEIVAVSHQLNFNRASFKNKRASLAMNVDVNAITDLLNLPDFDKERANLDDALEKSKGTVNNCPKLHNNEVTIRGIPFGPNNEFVKFATNAGKELQKIKERPLDALRDAPGNIVRETGRAIEEVGDLLGF